MHFQGLSSSDITSLQLDEPILIGLSLSEAVDLVDLLNQPSNEPLARALIQTLAHRADGEAAFLVLRIQP